MQENHAPRAESEGDQPRACGRRGQAKKGRSDWSHHEASWRRGPEDKVASILWAFVDSCRPRPGGVATHGALLDARRHGEAAGAPAPPLTLESQPPPQTALPLVQASPFHEFLLLSFRWVTAVRGNLCAPTPATSEACRGQANLGRNRWNLAEARPNLAEIRPTWVGQVLLGLDEACVGLGRLWPMFGRHRLVDFDRIWNEFCQTRPRLVTNLGRFRRHSDRLRPLSADLCPKSIKVRPI